MVKFSTVGYAFESPGMELSTRLRPRMSGLKWLLSKSDVTFELPVLAMEG